MNTSEELTKAFNTGQLLVGQLKGWDVEPVIVTTNELDFDRYDYNIFDKTFAIVDVDGQLFEYVALLFFKNGINIDSWEVLTPQERYDFIIHNRSNNYCEIDYEDLWERLFETYYHFKNYSNLY